MKKGFTLIELMVAVAIIALLVMVGYGAYLRSIRRGQDTRRLGDMKAFQNAMEQYFAVNDSTYPINDTQAGSQFPGGAVPVDPVNLGEFVYNRVYTSGVTYCGCAKLVLPAAGNASNNTCTYAAGGDYFCVSNLQ